MKWICGCFIVMACWFPKAGTSQELYVFSEPASNVPARSLSFKLTGRYPDSKYNNYFKQRYVPAILMGLSKNWMMYVSGGISDYYSTKLRPESLKAYVKHRFFSKDDVHRHFRMAAFAEIAYSRNEFLYDEFSLDGDLSGLQAGLVATQLINKLAVSGTVSYMRGLASYTQHHQDDGHGFDMLNYSLSAGYLVLPFTYTSYKQTNLNIYLEVLGMKGLNRGHYVVDIAPAVQLIFHSTTKLNLGARFQAKGNMTRVGENTYQVSVEHTILNAFKKRANGTAD